MNILRLWIFSTGLTLLALGVACAPKPVTERDRKEAAYLASEAQFAISIREWSRAEDLLAKAVQLAPTGDYWLSLGAVRVRLDRRSAAKEAYRSALKAYEAESARTNGQSEPWLKQAYVLALLGRQDASREAIAKAAKLFPNDGDVRAMADPAGFEKMISSQNFKDTAL